MKKVLLLMAMLTIGLASINAQDNLRWGATVGMNSSNFSITGFDSKIGFHAGVKAEVGLPQISEGVYLDMGALLTLKGAKIDGGSAASIKFNPYYLEITKKGSTKGGMVDHLVSLLGIDPGKVYCVGDNQNDIPMLARSAIPFAPANCAQEVRDWGARVLCHCDDGVIGDIVEILDKLY